MSLLITPENKFASAPYHLKKIRCPGHWLISPKEEIYLREPVPWAKDISNEVEYQGRRIKLRKTRIVKDRFGNKVIDWKKVERLKKQGKVCNPYVSASWAIENIYDPRSLLCLSCPKWCKEGKGKINEYSIRRLNG